jgi:hypothetical protein
MQKAVGLSTDLLGEILGRRQISDIQFDENEQLLGVGGFSSVIKGKLLMTNPLQ